MMLRGACLLRGRPGEAGQRGRRRGGPAGEGAELDELALGAAVGDDVSESEYDMADSLFADLELEEFQEEDDLELEAHDDYGEDLEFYMCGTGDKSAATLTCLRSTCARISGTSSCHPLGLQLVAHARLA